MTAVPNPVPATATVTQIVNVPTGTIVDDCPDQADKVYRSDLFYNEGLSTARKLHLTFTKRCGRRLMGQVLAQAFFFSIHDCIELCAGLNYWNGSDVAYCTSVLFVSNAPRPANCQAFGGPYGAVDADDKYESADVSL